MELEETSQILAHATPYSLAVIDELGRGTSTFDGAAIALAVLQELAERKKCRTLFATHYHLLGTLMHSPQIEPYHMGTSINQKTKQLHFLYKFVKGLCPDSYGRHVAKMAGLPEEVIDEAENRSKDWKKNHDSQGPELLLAEVVKLGKEAGNDAEGNNKMSEKAIAAITRLFETRGEWARSF
jgi:DNA mismatch repair ATPase MutS